MSLVPRSLSAQADMARMASVRPYLNAPAEIDDSGRSGRQDRNDLSYAKAGDIDEKWKRMFVGRRES
jgi:hypothetical protein